MVAVPSTVQQSVFCNLCQHNKPKRYRYCCSRSVWKQNRSLSSITCVATPGEPPAFQQRPKKQPWEARLLSSLLNVSSVPYSSCVPEPKTVLHRVNPLIKQLWLFCLLLVVSRASPVTRAIVAAGIAAISALCLPERLWKAQLQRLVYLCAFVFLLTATGAEAVPPKLQPRNVPPAVEGLVSITPAGNYNYVMLHLWIITVTQRSLKLAITAASVTFIALQSASLCLTTTPSEQLALALKTLLTPLKLLMVPVEEICFTLLLSLRFMALVFDEGRNLALGLAARAVDWANLGQGASLQIILVVGGRLFSNLLKRCDGVSVAMAARGFVGPRQHTLYITDDRQPSLLIDVVAIGLLVATCGAVVCMGA